MPEYTKAQQLGYEPGAKPKKKPRTDASPKRIAEIRAKKAMVCRVCGTPANVHAHHLVRRGSPHFGLWTENNIVGLCAQHHMEYHATGYGSPMKKRLRVLLTEAEVNYTDYRAYEGYVDDLLWRIRPVVTSADAA